MSHTKIPSPEQSENFLAEQPDLSRLLWVLQKARGFALYFARCNLPAYREKLVRLLEDRLDRPIVHVQLTHSDEGSLDFRVARALEKSALNAVVFVYNLEAFLPSQDSSLEEQTLTELNWRRGAFARLGRPIVFWLPEYAVTALARGAPDFFDWQSGVYEFDTPQVLLSDMMKTTAETIGDQAGVQGLSAEEKRRWRKVLEELLSESHGRTEAEQLARADLFYQLGNLASEQADYATARAAFADVLKIWKTAYGEEHPNISKVYSSLGILLMNLGDPEGARVHFERALPIAESAYGLNHPDVARDVNNLGAVLRALGDLEDALAHFERALAIHEAAYGPNHPTVAVDVNNLGGVLQGLGDLEGARAHFERALAIDEAAYGLNHPTVARDVNNLGSVLQGLGDLGGARAHFERALKIRQEFLGDDHPGTALVRRNLESLDA